MKSRLCALALLLMLMLPGTARAEATAAQQAESTPQAAAEFRPISLVRNR